MRGGEIVETGVSICAAGVASWRIQRGTRALVSQNAASIAIALVQQNVQCPVPKNEREIVEKVFRERVIALRRGDDPLGDQMCFLRFLKVIVFKREDLRNRHISFGYQNASAAFHTLNISAQMGF